MAENNHISSKALKQTLVFLHGWGVNAAIFDPVVKQLSTNYQVICLDLPGFGDQVEQFPAPYSLANVAKELSNTIPPSSIVIGWSLGGLVATQLALEYPEKVAKLVTIASSPAFVAKDNWPGIKPDVLAMFHRQLEGDISKTLAGFLKLQAMGSPHVRDDIRIIKQLVEQKPQPSKAVLDSGLDILADVDLRDQLENISQPFLRIYGKLDALVPHKAIVQIDDMAPASKSCILPKASHAPFISHQVEFIEVLDSWINTD